jgi:hypothetical protein
MKVMIALALIGIFLVSGCVAVDYMVDEVNEISCKHSGGTWLNASAHCCPEGCPLDEPDYASPSVMERCGVCWG